MQLLFVLPQKNSSNMRGTLVIPEKLHSMSLQLTQIHLLLTNDVKHLPHILWITCLTSRWVIEMIKMFHLSKGNTQRKLPSWRIEPHTFKFGTRTPRFRNSGELSSYQVYIWHVSCTPLRLALLTASSWYKDDAEYFPHVEQTAIVERLYA